MDIERFKEFLDEQVGEALSDYPNDALEQFYKVAIEFADLHIRKALERANKNARIISQDGKLCIAAGGHMGGQTYNYSIDKHSITNSYPKEFLTKNNIPKY